jgi:hypothetical protein
MTMFRFLSVLLATAVVLPATVIYEPQATADTGVVLYQFDGQTSTGLTELFSFQQVGPITIDESIPVGDLTNCNECAPLGFVVFATNTYDGDAAVEFPDQNGTSYDYYFMRGALTYDGSYETVVPVNTAALDVSGAPPIPEPNEGPAIVVAFVVVIIASKRYWLRLNA